MSVYESNFKAIERLYSSVNQWIDEDLYYSKFEKICNDYEASWSNNYKNDYETFGKNDLKSISWKDALPRILLQINERIMLTDCIYENIEKDFFSKYLYPPLINYLRLTCFDLLGQPAEWMQFDSWLNSNKKKEEREQIIATIKFSNSLDFTKKVYSEYLKIYSVRSSFFRFLNEILPSHDRDILMEKIKIDFIDYTSIKHDNSISFKEKQEYLYKIRNEYTHKVIANDKIHGSELKGNKEWHFREDDYKNNKHYRYFTSHDFSEYLKKIIYIGISEKIKTYQ